MGCVSSKSQTQAVAQEAPELVIPLEPDSVSSKSAAPSSEDAGDNPLAAAMAASVVSFNLEFGESGQANSFLCFAQPLILILSSR